MASKKNLPARLLRKGARAAKTEERVPGPSPNSATNLLIADILMRSAGRLFGRAMEKGLLRAHFSPDKAREVVKGRSFGKSMVSSAAARVATKSVPGALLIGGGLLARTLYDRSASRRKAHRKGEKVLAEQAAKADDTKL